MTSMSTPLPAKPSELPQAPSTLAERARLAPVSAELQAWFDLSPQALLLVGTGGQVVAQNAVWLDWCGQPLGSLDELPAAWQALIGWPTGMPGVGATLEHLGWAEDAGRRRRHLRVRVRQLEAAGRFMVQFEDLLVQDQRDLARIEMAALMGTAGVGVVTHDAAQGWVSTELPSAATGRSADAPDGLGAATTGSGPMAIGRDVVEPESMPEYDRLQAALRLRQRVEVRYAVRHRDTGQRWLLTRVEPASLGPDRAALSVVTLDVTEEEGARRRNERLLRELSTILDISPAGIAYLRGGTLARCNHRFESLLGLAEGTADRSQLDALLVRAGVPVPLASLALGKLDFVGSSEIEFQLAADASRSGRRPEARWCSLSLRRTAPDADGAADTVALLVDVTRLKSQQAALQGLERDRELMFSLSDVGIVYQRDDRIERANQAMAELTGHGQEALTSMPMAALYESPEAFAHYQRLEQHDVQLLGRARGERVLQRRDGSRIWVQVSQRPVEPRNPAAGFITSFVNVDDRRRARESMLVQADRTRAILDSVLVGIVTLGDQGIEWMNRSARRMFGGELADFMGLPMSVVATGDPDHPLRRTDWRATLEEGQAETFECRLIARDGRAFWVVGNVVVTGRESTGVQLTFALLDIERRRQAEVQIAQARASLQRIIETAPLAIALFDAASHEVLQLNQTVARFGGCAARAILGRPPVAWLPLPDAQALDQDLRQALYSNEMVQREWRRAAPPVSQGEPAAGAAEVRVWDTRIVSLRAGADAPDQLLWVASDVTEQRAADEARLQDAIAQRDMLVKEVHHRIKNNLQGVAGLLQQNARRHPEAAVAIAEAVGHVHAIAQVHGLQVGGVGPLRMQGVVEAIAASVQRMFGRTIRVEVAGFEPHRFALSETDSIPIALTINELLTNAIKHSASADSDIVCRLECAADELVIAVVNDAVLMPGFDLALVPPGISGLGLVRALLPRKGAQLTLVQQGAQVWARLRLSPPGVSLLEPQ
jgi:PAS domain S-box-containing protein